MVSGREDGLSALPRGVRRAGLRLRPGRGRVHRGRVLRHHARAHPEAARGARGGPPRCPRTRPRSRPWAACTRPSRSARRSPPSSSASGATPTGRKSSGSCSSRTTSTGRLRVALDQQKDGAHARGPVHGVRRKGREGRPRRPGPALRAVGPRPDGRRLDPARLHRGGAEDPPGKVPRQLGEPRGRREEPRAGLPRGGESTGPPSSPSRSTRRGWR